MRSSQKKIACVDLRVNAECLIFLMFDAQNVDILLTKAFVHHGLTLHDLVTNGLIVVVILILFLVHLALLRGRERHQVLQCKHTSRCT